MGKQRRNQNPHQGHWLLKSEPTAFSIEDLQARPQQTEPWDGVRNYQARNFLRNDMQPGDLAFFYHSNCAEPAIVGIAKVASAAYPDPTQFVAGHVHEDPASKPEDPRWWLVDVRFERCLRRPITLAELRSQGTRLDGLALLARGSRLSVMPVSAEHWNAILRMEDRDRQT